MDVFVGLDVETVDSAGGICEFAAVAINAAGEEVGQFVELVNPGPVKWNPNACNVHGLGVRSLRTLMQMQFANAVVVSGIEPRVDSGGECTCRKMEDGNS